MRELTDDQILDLIGETGQQAAVAVNQLIQDRFGAQVNIAVLIEPVGSEDSSNAILVSASIAVLSGTQDFQGTVRRILEKGYQQAVSRPPDIVAPMGHK